VPTWGDVHFDEIQNTEDYGAVGGLVWHPNVSQTVAQMAQAEALS
jgi:hypothetical protein